MENKLLSFLQSARNGFAYCKILLEPVIAAMKLE